MARISARFMNPNGRHVATVPARLYGMSTHFDAPQVGARCCGMGLHLKTDDGRTILVSLTHSELVWLAETAAGAVERYGRSDEPLPGG